MSVESMDFTASLSRSSPQVSAGSIAANRKWSGSSTRKRLASLPGFMMSSSIPNVRQEGSDERRHPGVEIGEAAYDHDIGELGLGLALKMGQNPQAQRRRWLARLQDLHERNARTAHNAIPPLVD